MHWNEKCLRQLAETQHWKYVTTWKCHLALFTYEINWGVNPVEIAIQRPTLIFRNKNNEDLFWHLFTEACIPIY